jgi:hypothetical protein
MTEMEERDPEIPETASIDSELPDDDQLAVEYDLSPEDESGEEVEGAEERPALTIVVQSWATPVIGILMLVIGLVGGYFGRPLLARQTPEPTPQMAVVQQTTAPSAQSPDSGELMRVVAEQTRHFVGSEDAPVTIIEFSDFQ